MITKTKNMITEISPTLRDLALGKDPYFEPSNGEGEPFIPKNPIDIYTLTLFQDEGTQLRLIKQLLLQYSQVSDPNPDIYSNIFLLADQYGSICATKSTFDRKTAIGLTQLCQSICKGYLETQRVDIPECGTSYIPKDPTPTWSSKQNPLVTSYIVGFAYGYAGGAKEKYSPCPVNPIENKVIKEDLLLVRRGLLDRVQRNPGQLIDDIFGFSSAATISSLEQLSDVKNKFQLILGIDWENRLSKIIGAKKKTKVGPVITTREKLIQKSAWDNEYRDPMLSQAKDLCAEETARLRINQIKQIERQIAQLSALGDPDIERSLAAFKDKFERGIIDWPELKKQTKNTQALTIIAEGIATDKKINILTINTADQLGIIQLYFDILKNEGYATETIKIIDCFLENLYSFKDFDKLDQDDIYRILFQSLKTYVFWNQTDKESLGTQLKAIVPALARAKIRERSAKQTKTGAPDQGIGLLIEKNSDLQVPLDRIDVLKKRLTDNGNKLSIAIKTCPSRRPTRLLDEYSKSSFYDTNPYKSDAVELIMATQEVVWSLEDSGIEVEITYVIMGTDERDYLEPVYQTIFDPSGKRAESIERKLVQFSLNLANFVKLALPSSNVSVIPIEDLEQELYETPYPQSYFDFLKLVAEEMAVSADPTISEALERSTESFRKKFNPDDGFYKAFWKPGINFTDTAARRAASYSLQMKAMLSKYDLLFDTAINPSADRTAILNYGLKVNSSNYGPISSIYASFGPRDSLKRKLYDKN